MLQPQPVPKVITFDCYGTLVRWHDAIRSAAHAILSGRLAESDAQDQSVALADRLRSAAVERQQRPPYCDYKSVLRSALAVALAEAGHTVKPEDEEMLLSTLSRIEPHPDVPGALGRLRERYRLAIISNTDDDLIAGTVAAIGVPIDFVITAEQARAYKPDHQLFLHAYATLGVTKEETVHVGMGQFTDLKVCNELGIRSVWIDRIGEPPNLDWPPHAKLNDLAGLPNMLSVA
ncbi:haloacid dehalogenase type II [Methylobacterium sp. J-030]|uniref:haloacid dehalogenase type II n=1 Tax=Methylobacterium sp. J-030 TaxID=2836627 RepID=UPI001FBB51E8|nr:haloacid dehalogenase type II [Methylobacterium sp. J-030]MCJ2069021.1 haloacid dehalogenase type II [Methylobacterium sp. J-030]